ncbi:hypothetical protein GCM10010038_33470 [Glutamicibacter protophormiae]|nr:hypothetical protein GCM10010038_33470 [Glutamicibacter protophormiae]
MMKLKIDFAGWFRVEDADRNAGSRIDAWGGAWTTITSDGLLGAGPGRYFEGTYGATVGLPDDPHNILLEIWSEFGLVLAIVLIVVMVLAWRTSAERGQAFVLLAVAVASVSGALATSLVFWMALALATSTQSLKNDKENVRRILDEYSDGSLKRVKKHKDPHGRGRY